MWRLTAHLHPQDLAGALHGAAVMSADLEVVASALMKNQVRRSGSLLFLREKGGTGLKRTSPFHTGQGQDRFEADLSFSYGTKAGQV
jgi:hypothetical protein